MANDKWAVLCKDEATEHGKSCVAPFDAPEQAEAWIAEDIDTNEGDRADYEIVPFYEAELQEEPYTYMLEWLDEQTTLEQVEAEHLVEDERLPGGKAVFGFINDQWEALKARFQEGDQWWNYCSDHDSWVQLAGRAGVALVRDDKIVGAITSRMS